MVLNNSGTSPLMESPARLSFSSLQTQQKNGRIILAARNMSLSRARNTGTSFVVMRGATFHLVACHACIFVCVFCFLNDLFRGDCRYDAVRGGQKRGSCSEVSQVQRQLWRTWSSQISKGSVKFCLFSATEKATTSPDFPARS